MTKMITKGRANARMKVEIGLRTQMSSKFLRTKAQICLRSKFMVLVSQTRQATKRRKEEKRACMICCTKSTLHGATNASVFGQDVNKKLRDRNFAMKADEAAYSRTHIHSMMSMSVSRDVPVPPRRISL